MRPLSLWLVADLGSVQGRQVAQNALSYLVGSTTKLCVLVASMLFLVQ